MSNTEKFFAFLNAADAVTLDDGAMLTNWETEPRTGLDSNEVARFSWTDGEADYSCILTEGGIVGGVFTDDGCFVGEDHEGQRTVFRFFTVHRITSA